MIVRGGLFSRLFYVLGHPDGDCCCFGHCVHMSALEIHRDERSLHLVAHKCNGRAELR